MPMFILAISSMIMSNWPWFMYLTFQVPMQCCSLEHQALFLPPDTSIAEGFFPFGPTTSFFLKLLLIALCSPVAYWILSNLVGLFSGVISLCLFIFSMRFSRRESWVCCHFLLHWPTFCQNSSLLPVHLGWHSMAWFLASLSYTSPFAMTRLWSIKWIQP